MFFATQIFAALGAPTLERPTVAPPPPGVDRAIAARVVEGTKVYGSSDTAVRALHGVSIGFAAVRRRGVTSLALTLVALAAGVAIACGNGDVAQDEPALADSAIADEARVSPGAQPPSVEPSKAETPSAEPPSAEPPSAEPPSAEPPSAEPPSGEPPSAEPPSAEPPRVEPPSAEPPSAETLSAALEAILAEAGAPAVAAAIFSVDGTIIDAAAIGVRRSGESTPVTVDDRFHLGSDVKAMTAALLGRLQEQGRGVSFDTTLSEAFPHGVAIHPDYAAVTLAQLLSHTGGIDDAVELDPDDSVLALPVEEQRAVIARLLLEMPPPIEPGTSSHYANLGYVVAGAALETATGMAWEELMRAELFEPLGMESCGFGAPGADGSEAPWGHDASGTPIDPTQPDTEIWRDPVIGPAGTVYCAMADWVKFLSELMRGLEGESDFLSRSTVERIFTPADVPYEGDPNGKYAFGWGVYESPFGAIYTHDGSNGLWYASVYLFPGLGTGRIAVSNGAGPVGPGGQVVQAAIGALFELYPPER